MCGLVWWTVNTFMSVLFWCLFLEMWNVVHALLCFCWSVYCGCAKTVWMKKSNSSFVYHIIVLYNIIHLLYISKLLLLFVFFFIWDDSYIVALYHFLDAVFHTISTDLCWGIIRTVALHPDEYSYVTGIWIKLYVMSIFNCGHEFLKKMQDIISMG